MPLDDINCEPFLVSELPPNPQLVVSRLVRTHPVRYLEDVLSQQQVVRSPDRGKHHVASATAQAPSVDETTIWHVLLSPGNVQQLTLDQLARYFDEEIITEQTYVWQTGMGDWLRLETVLAAHPEAPEQAPEEPFSVLMDDRSISKVYLDELADLYRLGIISGENLVWQKGMTGWEKLSELADLDEEELESAELQTNPFATRSVEQERATTRMNPRPAVLVEQEAPTLQRNAIPPQPSNRPVPVVSPSSMSPYPLGQSTAPVAYAYAEAPAEERKGFAEKFFFRAGLAATVLLALLRNDVLYSAATVAKKEADYLRTEANALGGPSFGTVRAVEELIRTTGGPLEPVRVPVFVTDLTTTAPPAQASNAPASNAPASNAQASRAPNSPAGTPAAKADAMQPAAAPRAGAALGGNVAAALLGQAKPAPQRAAASSRKGTSQKASATKSSSPTGSKNYYDPLNGAL